MLLSSIWHFPKRAMVAELRALQAYNASQIKEYSSVPRVPLYINGRFVQSQTTEWIPVHNPATQEVVSFVPQTTPDELAQVAKAAQAAFLGWRKTSVISRQQKMFQLQHLLRLNMVCTWRSVMARV